LLCSLLFPGPKARKKIAQGKRSAALGKPTKMNLSPEKGERKGGNE
jgi:hypothetical protein